MVFVLALAISGLFLVFLEFFLPGAVMAIGGGLLLVSSLLAFYMENATSLELFLWLCILVLLTVLTIRLALYILGSKKAKGSIVLQTDQEGFQASTLSNSLIGEIAVADTDFGPSGFILVHQQRFSAISQDGYVEKGSCVKIQGVSGSYYLVSLNRSED